MNSKDVQLLEHIQLYCRDVLEALDVYPTKSYEAFDDNRVLKNAVALPILQIGELAKKLSNEFKEQNDQISWREVVGMRNVIAHKYATVDAETLWETATKNIPELLDFCENKLAEIREDDEESEWDAEI